MNNHGQDPPAAALHRLREASLDRSYVSLGSRRTASVHEFYRYPGRFSPAFAKAAIEAFTCPGDLVFDPFVGGGTTLAEAALTGRSAIGIDMNPIATFVSAAKTTLYSDSELRSVLQWSDCLEEELSLGRSVAHLQEGWAEAGYLRLLDKKDTWRIRDLVSMALLTLHGLEKNEERLARCAILRTAQWALDMRSEVPRAAEFRAKLRENTVGMIQAARDFSSGVKGAVGLATLPESATFCTELPGLSRISRFSRQPRPKLILCSPPYPGVYVLYHRWKLKGRREIPAPFWIIGSPDGRGHSYYTMRARSQQSLDGYFRALGAAMQDVVSFADEGTWIVQMVGFNDINHQLPRYMEEMSSLGLKEIKMPELATGQDGRLWRAVPSRRWWVVAKGRRNTARQTAREVVLLHRKTCN